ncbi:hypothetical protein Patl1_07066 [Pistacia atlantica]|uniref:Uncharacterized protein n=1 Tax=Pistacia atlantica TaxID=434234 RepID=A0ACC1AGA3_9ROSI|nr:hypothetical protein Patl1_07066 [Pistacia atlantica]
MRREECALEADFLFIRYIFLLDKFGGVRWQGFGFSTPEELSSLLSCTSLLLEGE